MINKFLEKMKETTKATSTASGDPQNTFLGNPIWDPI